MTKTTDTVDVLVDAIYSAQTVSFVYDDKPRIVEVHALGESTKDGGLIMRGYQVAGESSRPLPAWALFTVSKIDALTPGFIKSEAPRDGYKLNDRAMQGIIAQVALEEMA